MPGDTAAQAKIVFAARPGQRVRELSLAAVDVGHARLPDCERDRSRASVRRRQRLGFPQGDWVAVEVSDPRFIEKVRAQHPRIAYVARHRTARVLAGDTWRACPGHGVVWIGVVKPIDVRSYHQGLARRDLVVQPAVE